MQSAVIFDIQRFCVHDGPGIRTTVFFKGCNLRCAWCHNPESMCQRPELKFYPEKCIGCGACEPACPHDAITAGQFSRALCIGCGKCAEACYAGARELCGTVMNTTQVMDSVRRDALFYQSSGGGLTCSGGEAMLAPDFLAELLAAAKREGINTAVDTAGCVPWANFEKVLPHADLFLYDLKAANPDTHATWTGQDNVLILQNLKRLTEAGAHVWIRIPVIPGVNANPYEMRAIGELVLRCGPVERVELNNYHRLGSGKYTALGRPCPMPADVAPLAAEPLEALKRMLQRMGLPVAGVNPE